MNLYVAGSLVLGSAVIVAAVVVAIRAERRKEPS